MAPIFNAFEHFDARFKFVTIGSAAVYPLFENCRWAEGPVWFADLNCLIWSDIPNNRMLRYVPDGTVDVFRANSNNSNGNTRDRQGRLVSCEHGSRSVTRTEPDGSITVLADGYRGKRLNSPNDVVVKSDGSVWFTDPVFGLLGHYEGYPAAPELPTNVYRVDPSTREIVAVIEGIGNPNGLAFSPDERLLYVVECMSSPRRILAYDVVGGGRSVANARTLIDAGPGTPDGFRVDVDGNLWCGWGMGSDELDGVRVFAPSGEPIGHIHLPERC